MKSFNDAHGDEWKLSLSYGMALDIKDRDGVDLLETELAEDLTPEELSRNGLIQVSANVETLINVLETMCADQIKERELTPRQFAYRFAGDVVDRAREALIGEVIDFFLQSGDKRRAGIAVTQRALVRKLMEVVAMEAEKASAAVDATDPSGLAEQLESSITAQSGDGPES